LAGDTYLPFLAANDAALRSGKLELTAELTGGAFTQPVFRYQAKCLAALRAAYASLDLPTRETLAPLLERTNCVSVLKGR
jgi:hypothetical protein